MDIWTKLKRAKKYFFYQLNTLNVKRVLRQEGVYMRLEMKFQPTIKEILFTLLFIADEMISNFVSGVVQEKRLVFVLMK